MNILVAVFAYNEIKHIPDMVEFYRRQGCDLFILDNMSNDGTYEWLVKNNIKTSRCDTKESFHLDQLQAELKKQVDLISPDWVVYTGIDSYYCFPSTIRDEILEADKQGFNIIETDYISTFNTGEDRKMPFIDNYFYCKREHMKLRMIGKYNSASFRFSADSVQVPDIKVYKNNGIYINYGMCKSKEEREETLTRRQKAWKMGLNRGYGTHYPSSQKVNWKWERDKLIDIRTIPEWGMIKKQLYES